MYLCTLTFLTWQQWDASTAALVAFGWSTINQRVACSWAASCIKHIGILTHMQCLPWNCYKNI